MKASAPKILLHLEGLAVLVGACALYAHLDFSWTRFALFLLAPDLALLGYLSGRKAGAICYNAVHTYLAPAVLLAVLLATQQRELLWVVVLWTVHIGMDRLCGFGLKYEGDPKVTHLHKV